MPSRILAPVLLGLGLLLAACGSSAPGPPPANQGLVLNRPTPQHLQLVDQHGQPVSLAALRGKVVVLAPFMSLCQDECPLVTASFISLQHDVMADGLSHRVAFVEATVDPGRDTVARLAAYQKEFGANWELWTGTPAQMHTFWNTFGVTAQIVPEPQPAAKDWWTGQPLTYDVLHTDGYILIDPSGRERFVDVSAPNLPNPSPKLKALLGTAGLRNLDHPQPNSWTIADVLTALGWVLGTNVAASGS